MPSGYDRLAKGADSIQAKNIFVHHHHLLLFYNWKYFVRISAPTEPLHFCKVYRFNNRVSYCLCRGRIFLKKTSCLESSEISLLAYLISGPINVDVRIATTPEHFLLKLVSLCLTFVILTQTSLCYLFVCMLSTYM